MTQFAIYYKHKIFKFKAFRRLSRLHRKPAGAKT
jgi:hypothetical protein